MSSSSMTFSAGETNLMTSYFKHFKRSPSDFINFKAVATDLKFKNTAVARATFHRLWKKHFPTPDPDPKAVTLAKATKRKAPDNADDGPTKRKPLSKISQVIKSEPSDDEKPLVPGPDSSVSKVNS